MTPGAQRYAGSHRSTPRARPVSTLAGERAVVEVDDHHDLRATIGALRRGAGDPCVRYLVGGTYWRATRTPDGPGTARYVPMPGRVVVDAWGPGAAWLLAHAADLIGASDDPSPFVPMVDRHPLVARLHRDTPGLRLPRSRAVYEAAVPAVIEQRVTSMEAKRTWRWLVNRYGEPAPGPRPPGGRPLRLPPPPATLAELPYHRFHPLGLERKRAEAVRAVARHADRLERCEDVASARAVLGSIPGVGVWTTAEVTVRAFGDPDAVSVGDYHLKHDVCFALAGERNGTDERMLDLLAPWAGQRARVVQLLARGPRRPRRGPRLHPMDHRHR